MPFPGNMVPAPVMAAKQGMKDVSFAQITDSGQSVMQYVDGPLTGRGSGLQSQAQQVNAAPTAGTLTQPAKARSPRPPASPPRPRPPPAC